MYVYVNIFCITVPITFNSLSSVNPKQSFAKSKITGSNSTTYVKETEDQFNIAHHQMERRQQERKKKVQLPQCPEKEGTHEETWEEAQRQDQLLLFSPERQRFLNKKCQNTLTHDQWIKYYQHKQQRLYWKVAMNTQAHQYHVYLWLA